MKNLAVVLVVAGIAFFCIRAVFSPGTPDLTISGDEVQLVTGDLDVRFAKDESFEDTFMIFGGGYLDHPNAIANVTVAGLSTRHAKPIYQRYPDFHRCASPGAALAKDKVAQIDMVPANGEALKTLRSSLEEFEGNIRSGGDRVCVRLRGSQLTLTAAEIPEVGESILDSYPNKRFYLIDSARRVECREVLGGA